MCSCTFFFFKEKAEYELRISDWSSDGCSSDLLSAGSSADRVEDDLADMLSRLHPRMGGGGFRQWKHPVHHGRELAGVDQRPDIAAQFIAIGRASCRERVCR